MLFNVETTVLDAALKVVASLPDTDEHTMAAAAMDADGVIYTGVNVHHFTGGPCAEVVVLGVAAAAAAAPLITMVAVGSDGRGILPLSSSLRTGPEPCEVRAVIRPALMRQLMDEDDANDEAGTGEALLAALQLHYPNLTPASPSEHVSFRCLPA